VLATEEGRVEILLTPGVFLRLAENSSARMISNKLSDTRLEILSGTALVEVGELLPDNALAFRVAGAEIVLPKKGLYRIDASPARLHVEEGQALVSLGEQTLTARKGHEVDIDDGKLADAKFDTKDTDPFYRWNARRSSYIAEANVVSAQVASNSGYGSGFGNGFSGDGFGAGGYNLGGYNLGGYGFNGYSVGQNGWAWNPYFGMYTFMPGSGIYMNPFGYAFYSPGTIGYYTPTYFGTGGVAAAPVPSSASTAAVHSNGGARMGSVGGGASAGRSGGRR